MEVDGDQTQLVALPADAVYGGVLSACGAQPEALSARFRSRQKHPFAEKGLSAMRSGAGCPSKTPNLWIPNESVLESFSRSLEQKR